MAKLGALDFPDCIVDALRDDRLVVFAGAGVSRGAPSNLPLFDELAKDIASGTGLTCGPHEPIDRFLGSLHHKGIAVHDRAALRLRPAGSMPTALHLNLLRFFRSAEQVKLVTTNFDLHFEGAAQELYGKLPDAFRAPALPLGYDFRGIVHLHGELTHPRDMTLTDADFGRAYLTEGWARRFLVEVFRNYTVLFIGYSHTDVVMNYLARALPADGVAGRFALTEEVENWGLLGITPIRFNRGAAAGDFHDLYDGVKRLAERATRGALDWQSRLAEIGRHPPPTDDEAIGEVEQALREVHTTRFLVNIARDPQWPKWMDGRKQIEALFGVAELSERDRLLALWLAEHYAIEQPEEMFDITAAHNLSLNPIFWWSVGHVIGVNKEKNLEQSALRRWVTILLASAPIQADRHVLMWLAERCSLQGEIHLLLKIFLFMGEHRLSIKPSFHIQEQEEGDRRNRLNLECPLRADHWTLDQIWGSHIKPNLATLAQPLLSGIARRLEGIYQDFLAWSGAPEGWDPVAYGRSAIEQHSQDQYPEALDVLIDAARDALEWLSANAPAQADAWIENLMSSGVPILQRLAIHAVTEQSGRSSDDRLKWLLTRAGLHHTVTHHEVFRAAALAYPTSNPDMRKAVVDAVLAYQAPPSDEWFASKETARAHYNWLAWLRQADPGCSIVNSALAPIEEEYPGWQQSEHPDLMSWIGPVRSMVPESPWTVTELLVQQPEDQIDELLKFSGNRFEGPDRNGLIGAIKEACKQRPAWAFTLAETLTTKALWTSDLWTGITRGLQEAELNADDWRTLLTLIDKPDLQAAHPSDLANLIYSVVRDGGKPFALELLAQANKIALRLWEGLETNDRDDETTDWLSRAINRPAGVIVEFWINGLSLMNRGKSGNERVLPNDYRQWFTMALQDPTAKGGFARSLVASQIAFLFGLDEEWAREKIVPLFSDPDKLRFGQAWDGFLAYGRLYPALVDALLPAFLGALSRLDTDLPDRRRRFVEYFAVLAVLHVNDPTVQLLPDFLQHASPADRIYFARQLGHLLRQMESAAKKQMWDRWLLRYWRARLQAVPAALQEGEIGGMLEWLTYLGDAYPEAVALAVQSPAVKIDHSDLLFRLQESDLVSRFHNDTAALLIYLCTCVVGYHVADLGKIAGRLSNLEPVLRGRLDEALARAGSPKSSDGLM